MGNIVQSVYNYIFGNVENTSSNITNFNNNQIAKLIMAQNIQENESVKNKSINWLPVANCFTGREDILKIMQEEFTNKKYVVLHGMPGIGKTETARQFGARNCDFFHGNLIWIFSETPVNIKQCFDKLATSLKLKISDTSLIFNQFKTSKALFVFDNAENMAAIKDYLPSNQLHPTVYVLITSRLSKWSPSTSISKISLGSLNIEDSLSIFKLKLAEKYEEYNPGKWKELVHKLDGIPLCLQIVSSLIQQEVDRIRLTEFNLENFINEMEEKIISSTISEFEQDYYQKSVAAAISSVLNRFEKLKAISSLDLLCFIAYLDSDLIYDNFLFLIPSIEGSIHQLEEALNNLVDYSLIEIVEDSYLSQMKIKVHRTVQLVLRNYDLKKRNGDMFITLLRSMYREMYLHHISIFKYANKKEFHEKTIEFYNEIHKNEFLIEEFVWKLIKYNCDETLQIILPKLRNNRSGKLIQMLINAIDFDRDFKTIQVFLKTIAQNEEDVHQIEALPEWPSTKLIDIILGSNIWKNRINDLYYFQDILFQSNILKYRKISSKTFAVGEFLHLLVRKSNKENVIQTVECINHLTSKWDADILYHDDVLNNILHTACRNWQISLDIIEYLFKVENGKLIKQVNFQNKNKETPLHVLLDYNYSNPDIFKIVRYFICEYKANITIQDNSGKNILFDICRYGSFEMIKFILRERERDCSQIINDQDNSGDVTFSQLIWNNSIEERDKIKLFNSFFQYGMNINLKNKENNTPLEISERNGLNTLSRVIKEHLKELEQAKV